MLTTKTKVSLAALAYMAVSRSRALFGLNDYATVRRGGVRWSLDLSEGIDFSIYLLGAFERSTVATLRKLVQPGNIVFDIGANIGAHTLGLARSVGSSGQVFAIEPTDFAFGKLARNIELNPDLASRIHPRQIFFADNVAAAAQPQIYASWPLNTNTAVHPKHRGRLATARNAVVDSLDRFVERERISRVNVIKLDVDGHELPVLRGGLRTLKTFQPALVMEISPYIHAEEDSDFESLVALLADVGYAFQDASTWRSLPVNARELNARIPDGASINVIARANNTRAR